MTQKFYFHNATSPDTGTLPGVNSLNTTVPDAQAGGVAASTNRDMDGVIGLAQVASEVVALADPTNTAWMRRFISRPLAAGSIASGTWTGASAGIRVGVASANLYIGVWHWRPSTGLKITTITDVAIIAAIGTSETAVSATFTGAAFVLVDGDILVVEIWMFRSGGPLNGCDVNTYYDGTTEASVSSNAGFVLAPVDLPLSGGGPTLPLRPRPIQMVS